VHGVFGATAATAKLLDLDVVGIANALGLALSRAGGTQQALLEKSLAKRRNPVSRRIPASSPRNSPPPASAARAKRSKASSGFTRCMAKAMSRH